MDPDSTPVPASPGALVPTASLPPATVAGLLPAPQSGAGSRPAGTWRRLLASTRALVDAVLDLTDDAVDRVAETVGLRPERR